MKPIRTPVQYDPVHTSEVELKFTLGKTSTSRLLRYPALAGLHQTPNQREIHKDRYFDSADFALAHFGLSLRIREDRGKWRQTVKDSPIPTAGLHRRAEYECGLRGPELDEEQLERTPWASIFARLRGQLVPVFDIRCTRTIVPLTFADGSRAQLCIDRGHIVGRGATLPLAELELEFEHGQVARLYELARQLASTFGLRIEPRSKAQRGMALVGAAWGRGARTMNVDFHFKTGEDAGAAVERLCRHTLQQVFEHAQNATEHNDPEDIHRTRIDLRQIQTLLWFATKMRPTSTVDAAQGAVRALYRALGAARDWDVFARHLLARDCSPALLSVFEGLRAAATQILDEQLIQARHALQSMEFQDVLLAIACETCELTPGQSRPSDELAPGLVHKIAQRDRELRKRIEKLHAQTPAEQHVTRRLARRLRERAELIARTVRTGRKKKRYLARLAKLQGALGHLHDWYTARSLLKVLKPDADIRAQAWVDHGQSQAMRAAVRASERFLEIPSIWH